MAHVEGVGGIKMVKTLYRILDRTVLGYAAYLLPISRGGNFANVAYYVIVDTIYQQSQYREKSEF